MKEERIKMGIAWYTKKQWQILKEVADDSADLDETYKDWKKNAKKLIKGIKQAGDIPDKINIDMKKLKKWCAQNSKPIIQKSRSEYVTVLLKEKYE
jgi:hypothetical protein